MPHSVRWDPKQYARYADERGRPFGELVARVNQLAPDLDPAYVVDLGCGPGELTVTLAERWPAARVHGVDSSPEMIDRTAEHAVPGRLTFERADLRDWSPEAPVDLLISNATFQWVPEHLKLLPGLVAGVRPGGMLAFAVPGNFDAPSHRILGELAASEPWAPHLTDVRILKPVPDPETYLAVLTGLGCRVDAWETTYCHVLEGPDPVFEWIRGTGARPVLQALPEDLRLAFEVAYKQRLRAAYPERAFGTVLPFRRIFVVAEVRGGRA